jgi:hypothetical protein
MHVIFWWALRTAEGVHKQMSDDDMSATSPSATSGDSAPTCPTTPSPCLTARARRQLIPCRRSDGMA